MIWARLVKSVNKLGIAALVLCALATSGKAQQSIYQGKFTLPVETHWGTATLPAGDYTFTDLEGSLTGTVRLESPPAGFFLIRIAPLALQHLIILQCHASPANPVTAVPRMYMVEIGQRASPRRGY